MQCFIVNYTVTDGCTYSSDVHAPVFAESRDELVRMFETALAAYDPNGIHKSFLCGGQIFNYDDFIEWSPAKRGSERVYDYSMPDIMTMDEWSKASVSTSSHTYAREAHRTFVADDAVTPDSVLSELSTRDKTEDFSRRP